MPIGELGPSYWLAQQLDALRKQVQSLSIISAIQNTSSDGKNGWLRIFANAVNNQPSLDFHYTGGGGDILAQIYQDVGGNIRITGGLQVSGTKNFVMKHPSQPGWVLRHASTESPVNGVEYWGDSYIEPSGTVLVKLPSYFEQLTKPDNRSVQLTAIDVPADLAASRVTAGGFTVTGPPGAEFYWVVKAERATQPGDWPIDFLAEEAGELAPPPPPPPPVVITPDGPVPVVVPTPDPVVVQAINDAVAEGMPEPPEEFWKPSSPMVDVPWEKRPDRPPKPPRDPDPQPSPDPAPTT